MPTGLTVDSVKITGAAPGAFPVVEDFCTGATLASKDGCAVAVAFAPAAGGALAASLTVSTSDRLAPIVTAALTGDGDDAPTATVSRSASTTVRPPRTRTRRTRTATGWVTSDPVDGEQEMLPRGVIDLARTGQRQTFAPADDGALRTGVPWPADRFVDNGDGTISDTLTGLVWLQDANCLASAGRRGARNGKVKLSAAASFIAGINAGTRPRAAPGSPTGACPTQASWNRW